MRDVDEGGGGGEQQRPKKDEKRGREEEKLRAMKADCHGNERIVSFVVWQSSHTYIHTERKNRQ
jgi:hypothetical protein